MRVLVNFMRRDVWQVHCIAEDSKTPISLFRTVRHQATLTRLLRYVGADDAEIEQANDCIRKWSRGGVRIELEPGARTCSASGGRGATRLAVAGMTSNQAADHSEITSRLFALLNAATSR
jgi:hypothetical protein